MTRVPCAGAKPSAACAIEEVLDRRCIPSAAACSENAVSVELLGDAVKASRSFTADGLDYGQDAVHIRIRLGFHSCDGIGVHLALVLGNGGEHMDC